MILVTVTTGTSYSEYWVEDHNELPLTSSLEKVSGSHPANTHRLTDMGRPSTII